MHRSAKLPAATGLWSVAAYLLLMPLSAARVDGLGGHDLARLAQITLGMVCALTLIAAPLRPHVRAGRWVAAACLALALLACASATGSAMPVMAARELALFAGMAAVALAVARLRDVVHAPSALASTAAALYVLLIVGVFVATTLGGAPVRRTELFAGYDNYRFFNHVQTVALPLAVLAVVLAGGQGHRFGLAAAAAWVAAAGGFALLFATMGRGTLVGLLAGALAAAALGRPAWPLLRALAISAIAGAAFFALLFLVFPWALGVPANLQADFYGAREGSVQMRLMLWRIALAHAADAPWLGIGPMHYAHHPTGDASHPHNFYLQVAAEFGWPALVLMLAVGSAGIARLVTAIRQCPPGPAQWCGVGLLVACTSIAVDALFSGNLVMPVSQVWIAATVGWAIGWVRGQHDRAAPSAATVRRAAVWRTLVVALLASQVWLAIDIHAEAMALAQHLDDVMARFPSGTTNPRFWSHGWF